MIENVPELGWDKGKCVTFMASLESAMSVTEHPVKYSDLMGWSGMAFRVRWFEAKDDSGACPSAEVAEFPDEIQGVQDLSGWILRCEFDDTPSALTRFKGDIVASIDAGKPVLLYDPGWDVAVAYGYKDSGDTVLLRSYAPHFSEIKLADSPAFLCLLQEYSEPPAKKDAFLQSLKKAVKNWHREPMDSDKGRYLYGVAGLDKWMKDYGRFDELTEEAQKTTSHASRFCYMTLLDCKAAAATFIGDHASLMNDEAQAHLKKAADIYRQDWPSDIPMGDLKAFPNHLRHVQEICSQAIEEIEKALEAEGVEAM